jgi:hypothetical protein
MNTRLKGITVAGSAILLAGLLALPFALSDVDVEARFPCDLQSNGITDERALSVCELTNRKLLDKQVQVSGTFYNDSWQLSLHGAGCSVAVGLADPQQCCKGAWHRLQLVSGVRTWYDGNADVTVVGKMATIPAGNYYEGSQGFVLSCIQQVRTEPTLRERINYTLHRLVP